MVDDETIAKIAAMPVRFIALTEWPSHRVEDVARADLQPSDLHLVIGSDLESGRDPVRLLREIHELHVHGGTNPNTYKTIRNALRNAGSDGVVLALDLTRLPIVHPVALDPRIDARNEPDLASLAERQMLWWGDLFHRLTGG